MLSRCMAVQAIWRSSRPCLMPHIKDSDMEELAEQVLGKLQNMSDEEFAGVVLEPAEEIS